MSSTAGRNRLSCTGNFYFPAFPIASQDRIHQLCAQSDCTWCQERTHERELASRPLSAEEVVNHRMLDRLLTVKQIQGAPPYLGQGDVTAHC